MSMPVTAFIGLLTAAPVVAQERIAITSATVIDGRSGRATGESTILIEGNRIVAVGPDGSVRIPEFTRVIDAAGKWVTPGFVDVHTHSAPPAILQRALKLGITTIHMMSSVPATPDSMRQLEAWSNLADSPTPRMHITSPLFTGSFPAMCCAEPYIRWCPCDRHGGPARHCRSGKTRRPVDSES